MSVDQMLACSDASEAEAEAGLPPYSDSLGSVIMNQLYWRGTGRIYWR